MGTEAATVPDPVFLAANDPDAVAAWDELVLASSASIRQTSWWNAPNAELGVATDIVVLAGGAPARGGMLVRSARMPAVPLTVASCIAGPVVQDWDPDLARPAAAALEELTRSRRSIELTLVCPGGTSCADVTSVCADALAFDLPTDPTVLYLCNPFEGPTLGRFLDRVEQSLRDHPRPLHVLAFNPGMEPPLRAATWLRQTGNGWSHSTWTSKLPTEP